MNNMQSNPDLDTTKHPCAVHSACLIDSVTPDVKDGLCGSNNSTDQWSNCHSDPQLKLVEGMFVDVLKFVIHLGSKVDQVTQVVELIFRFCYWCDPTCCHISASDCFYLLNCFELVIVKQLIEVYNDFIQKSNTLNSFVNVLRIELSEIGNTGKENSGIRPERKRMKRSSS